VGEVWVVRLLFVASSGNENHRLCWYHLRLVSMVLQLLKSLMSKMNPTSLAQPDLGKLFRYSDLNQTSRCWGSARNGTPFA
jgi:hypothetical protein